MTPNPEYSGTWTVGAIACLRRRSGTLPREEALRRWVVAGTSLLTAAT
jgi:hypothetical protein